MAGVGALRARWTGLGLLRDSKAAGTITSYGIFIGSEEARLRGCSNRCWGSVSPRLRSRPCPISMPGFTSPALQRRSTEKGQVLLGLGLSLLTAQGDRDRTPFPGRRPQSHGRHMVLELGWCGRSDTDRRYGVLPQEATLLHRVGHLMGEGQGGEGDHGVDRAIPCGDGPLCQRILH